MHVGLNLLYLLPGEVGGTETYATCLIEALVARDGRTDDRTDSPDGTRYTLYVNRESADHPLTKLDGVRTVVCDVDARSRARRYLFEQTRLPALVRADGVDVLHSLGYVGPLRAPCPQVVTIHDLIYVGFADHMSRTRRLTLRFFVRGVARRAARVIAVSHASKDQIVADIGLGEDRVTVVHGARRSDAAGAPSRAQVADVLDIHGIAERYVVAFSSRMAAKNIDRLVDAFAAMGRGPSLRLVVVGLAPDGTAIDDAIARAGASAPVTCTGWVPDTHVAPLIAGAELFVFPSLYEGFGLPVLDAQSLGVPVVCSDAGSLPEVAGAGAEYFDPTDVTAMAGVIGRVLDDDHRRTALVEAGRRNVERFSWAAAAAQTHDVYRSVTR